MYYNIKNQSISSYLPNHAYNNNNILIQKLQYADIETKADCGYYIIRSDNPPQLDNTIENINARVVIIDKPYVDITRTWMDIPIE